MISKVFSKTPGLKPIFAIGILSVAVVVLVMVFSNSSINPQNLLGAAAVSESFLNELLNEPDTTVMIQKAQNAGLTVESQIYDDGEAHKIKDSSGEIVLDVASQNSITVPLVFNKKGSSVTCKLGDHRIWVKDGKFHSIGKNTKSPVFKFAKKPDDMSEGDYATMKALVHQEVQSLNQFLDNYSGDTSQIPRFVQLGDSAIYDTQPTDIDIQFTINPSGGAGGVAELKTSKYGQVHGTIYLPKGVLKPPMALGAEDMLATRALIVHEFGHLLGLGHVDKAGELMAPAPGQNLKLSNDAIDALISANSAFPHVIL